IFGGERRRFGASTTEVTMFHDPAGIRPCSRSSLPRPVAMPPERGTDGAARGDATCLPRDDRDTAQPAKSPVAASDFAVATEKAARCGAAHPDDPRPCEGRPDAVRVVDQTGVSTHGCLLHAAVLLASLAGGRVYPMHGPPGSAIEVYSRARMLP